MRQKKAKTRNELVLSYVPLVHNVVQKFQKSVNTIWNIEDLISIGTIGLINAVDTYNVNKGASLYTYAWRKINGAVLDYFRTEDYLSRSNRFKFKKTEEAIRYLEHELGRHADTSEVAERLQKSLEDYYEHIFETQQRQMQSIEESDENSLSHFSYNETTISGNINLEQDSFYRPDNLLSSKEFINKLYNIILEFSEREQIVFALYFYEALSLRQIGLLLKLGEPRVSQILRKTMFSIRRELYA